MWVEITLKSENFQRKTNCQREDRQLAPEFTRIPTLFRFITWKFSPFSIKKVNIHQEASANDVIIELALFLIYITQKTRYPSEQHRKALLFANVYHCNERAQWI